MHFYRIGGLEIRSMLELPEAEPGGTGRDASVEVGQVQPIETGDEEYFRQISSEEAIFYYKGVGRFHVHGSRGITIDRFEGVDEAEIRSWLYGIPLAALFHYRGFLVLHASVVEASGRALVFAGDPNDGKSTTAAAFVSGGAKFIADDHAYLEV